tara:strand:+ start:675 stop:878 length:204 start_codon:yes stop_codon:yes gene_type:complete
MSGKKLITVTQSYEVDDDIMTDAEWDALEDDLDSGNLSNKGLATRLGMSEELLQSNLSESETTIIDC